jgi:predicted small metal-binding protein
MPESEYYMFCCREAMRPCGFEVKAKTKEEAMEHAKAHTESAHGEEVTPEMEKKMKETIKPVTVTE